MFWLICYFCILCIWFNKGFWTKWIFFQARKIFTGSSIQERNKIAFYYEIMFYVCEKIQVEVSLMQSFIFAHSVWLYYIQMKFSLSSISIYFSKVLLLLFFYLHLFSTAYSHDRVFVFDFPLSTYCHFFPVSSVSLFVYYSNDFYTWSDTSKIAGVFVFHI